MNVNSLNQLVDDQRRDTTSNFVDTNEILRYYNQFGRMVIQEVDLDATVVSASITYTSAASKYALSAIGNNDWKDPISLFAGYQSQFDYVSVEDFLILSSLGRNVWATDSNYMYIYNTTNVTALSATYYSKYMALTSGNSLISELTNTTDVPILPTFYHDAYVDYALSMIYRKEGLTDDYAATSQILERKIRNLKNENISKRAWVLKRGKHINERNTGFTAYDRREGWNLN